MKKFLLTTLLSLLAVCTLAVFAACGNGDNTKKPDDTDKKAVYTVEISETSLTLDVYEKYNLTAVVKDGDGKTVDKGVEWSSSSQSVLMVDGGLVFAKSMGTATVTAKVEGEDAQSTASITVSMRGNVPVLSLSEETSLSIAVGSTFDLSPRVLFKGEDATDSDTTFIYNVSDPAVATVANGTVTALKAGTAQITVTASWRGIGGQELVGSEDALGLRITLELTVKTV